MISKLLLTFTLFISLLSIQAKQSVVVLETNQGNVEIKLFDDKAPETVKNFLKYVNDGFYNQTIFHRIIDGFMIQGGGYTTSLNKKETRDAIKNEADNGLQNTTGTIAMARTNDPHSATAQFFINVNDNSSLNHFAKTGRGWGYAVFGQVAKGMSVVNKIKKVSTRRNGPFGDLPVENIIIKKAYVKK